MIQKRRPTCVTVIGWAWIVGGASWVVIGGVSFSVWLAICDQLRPPIPWFVPLIALVTIAVGVFSMVAGVYFHRLKRWARAALEVLTWLLVAYMALCAIGFACVFVFWYITKSGDDSARFSGFATSVFVASLVLYGTPIVIVLKCLRGDTVRDAIMGTWTPVNGATTNDPNAPQRRRRPYQYSIRTLLVLTLVVAVALSWPAWKLQQARKQHSLLLEIQELGGRVEKYGDGVWLQFFGESFAPVEELKLSGTLVTNAHLKRLKTLPMLQSLDLDETQIANEGLRHLKGLTNLKTLGLDRTHVTDAGLEHLGGLTNLQSLDLDETQIANEGLRHLKGLANLRDLFLGHTQVTDAGLEHLGGLANLESLILRDTQVSDTGLEHLKRLTNLNTLFLSDTSITDAGLEHLGGLTDLEWLWLDNTQVSDRGLEHLKGLANLKKLILLDTRITDAGLEHLKGATNLEQLNLNDTRVGDPGLEHLKGLTSLKWLHLKRTQVTNEGVEKLQQALPNCEISYQPETGPIDPSYTGKEGGDTL